MIKMETNNIPRGRMNTIMMSHQSKGQQPAELIFMLVGDTHLVALLILYQLLNLVFSEIKRRLSSSSFQSSTWRETVQLALVFLTKT